jgi:hypothetical protein
MEIEYSILKFYFIKTEFKYENYLNFTCSTLKKCLPIPFYLKISIYILNCFQKFLEEDEVNKYTLTTKEIYKDLK